MSSRHCLFTSQQCTKVAPSLAYGRNLTLRQIAGGPPSHYTDAIANSWSNILSRMFKGLLLILFIQSSVPSLAWSEDWQFNDVDRVVAIADIHGAYDAMVTTLKNAKILNDDLGWVGGESHLVIVGDILDRGPKSRAAMDLLIRIEDEASQAGGNVHILIGNHESMLLTGDLRYVSAAEYEAFAHEEEPEERARWFELYIEREGGDEDQLRQEFDKSFPPGYFAMRRAFRADGQYGSWLLQKNVIAVINQTAFVHGGLSPVVAEIGLEGVNGRLQKELIEYVETLNALTDAEILLPTDSHYDYEVLLSNYMPALNEEPETLQAIADAVRLGNSSLISTDGPLWYRNNILCPRIVEEHRLDAALAAIGAKRVVVGHTPTPNRQVMQRFDGRVIEIDTGMLNFYYKGTGHALVLEGETVSVTNQAGVDTLVPVEQQRNVGRRPGNLTAKDLEELLEHGEILSVEADTSQPASSATRTIVKVSNGENTINAVFSKRRHRGSYPSVAAYRLDQLLQLDMVPVTVIRQVEGDDGSLQFLPDNSINELERSTSGQGGDAWCAIPDQWVAMYVFDVLVFNEGRSQQRMLYDRSSWRLILSEHDRAFASKKGRPGHLKKAALPVSQGWKNELSELTDEVIAAQFSDVLDKRRRRALSSRRDQLLATP